MILKFEKNSNINLSRYGAPNFNSKEFDCKCKYNKCKYTYIDQDLLILLQQIRNKFNKPITINSGYRCKAHNKSIGGKPKSQHIQGTAADIVVKEIISNDVANYVESINSNGGVGRYITFTHVDTRGYKARWDNRYV